MGHQDWLETGFGIMKRLTEGLDMDYLIALPSGDLCSLKPVEATFADGMALSFWLSGSGSQSCCRFVGGPYLLPAYLGPGMAIATRRDRPELAAAFDYALHEINANGTFAELYLRYFPISFF